MTVIEHANGARSVIAYALSGRQREVADSWYEHANEVLEELSIAGYVVHKNDQPATEVKCHVIHCDEKPFIVKDRRRHRFMCPHHGLIIVSRVEDE